MAAKPSVVVYSRLPAVDLANVALWMRQKRIYTLAKPGGVCAQAITILANLLFSQGLSPDLRTEEEAQMAFGRLSFPPMKWKVEKPDKLAVETAALSWLGKLHEEEGQLVRGEDPKQFSAVADDLSDDELNRRQAAKDAEQVRVEKENNANIMRLSVLSESTTLTRERYNEKFPEMQITEEEMEKERAARIERGKKEAEDAPRRKAALIEREEALIEREKEERRKRKEAKKLAAIQEEEE